MKKIIAIATWFFCLYAFVNPALLTGGWLGDQQFDSSMAPLFLGNAVMFGYGGNILVGLISISCLIAVIVLPFIGKLEFKYRIGIDTIGLLCFIIGSVIALGENSSGAKSLGVNASITFGPGFYMVIVGYVIYMVVHAWEKITPK